MYNLKVNEGDLEWTPLDIPGVSMKVLNKDKVTGAMAVITRMEPGTKIPAHYHTTADETVYVIEGDLVENGVSYGPGSYFVGKAGTPHGPHTTVSGCKVLTHFGAKLDIRMA